MYNAERDTIDLIDGVEAYAKANPHAPCLIFNGNVTDFGAFSARTTAIAEAMRSRGMAPGDRVAILSRSSPAFFELLFACAKSGLILAPLNNRLSRREVAEVLNDANPVLVLVSDEFRPLLPEGGPWQVVADDDLTGWIDGGSRVALSGIRSPDDPILILYTSGTTGSPKGVTLSERNLVYLKRMARELWAFSVDSANLVSSPLFHIGGIGWGLLALSLGGRTVIARDADPEALLGLMRQHSVTHAFMVPTVIQRLVDFIAADGLEPPPIQHLFYGAAPIGDGLLRRAIATFGCDFHHVYGMTETAGTVVTLDPIDHDPDGPAPHRLQSCGKAMPWVEIEIIDPNTGAVLAPGVVGEIRLRSEAITKGYWYKDAETAKAITPEGWLCTGDAGELDSDGYLYIRDRYKDMIVSGGENIYPKEIENVLQFHPAIAEVAVIGTPHPKWGETPVAVVVLRPGQAASETELIEFTRERLARYKSPSRVEFRESLPRNASGKVMKHLLRD